MTLITGMGIGRTDEWYTPAYVFEALGERFDLDVASPRQATNVPADQFIYERSLETPWFGFVWMNPPFGGQNGIAPWMDKFMEHGHGIALTPDRTSAGWFRTAWGRADMAMFTPRVAFERPDGSRGTIPANGTCLWARGDRATQALINAAGRGFGVLALPLP